MAELESGLSDRISATFRGKKVLITGGTGFIGKVLIEKLLRLCPDIGSIILIVRPQKGKSPKERVDDIFKNPLFGPLLSSRDLKTVLPLVTAVCGDVKEKDLGLSEEDRAICQTANIIVHSAATIRFDETIKTAVLLNTRGTKYMLELAKQCKSLEFFMHVSTAYCHPKEKILEERLYPPPYDPDEVINLVESIDDSVLNVLTAKLSTEFPNTYVYSKALSETLVGNAMDVLPAVIVRPSVTVPILMGPVKGWTDNINGPTGLLIGAGKGVIRTMYGNDQFFADFIPVDCLVDAMMTITWDYLENGCPRKVHNLTTSDEISITWKEIINIGKAITVNEIPFDVILWYPGGTMTKYLWFHKLRSILFHWVPAILVDILLFCLGQKPLLIRVQNKISKNFEILQYYVNNQWQFKSENIKITRMKMNEVEKKRYKLETNDFDINEYFHHGILAARRYILKEKDENLPKAKLRMKIMRYLDLAVKGIFFAYVVYWIYNKLANFF